MVLFWIVYLALVSGERTPNTSFVLSVISDAGCDSDVHLSMTSLHVTDADVTIELPRRPDVDAINASVRYGHWTNVTLPPHVRLKKSDLTENGIEVYATSPISLYLMEPIQCGGRSTQILPSYLLGTHYILHSQQNNTKRTTTFMAITATTEKTQVGVTLHSINNASQISFDNATYHVGDTIQTELGPFQTMLLKCSHGISKIDVKTSASVAAFCVQDGMFGVAPRTMNQLLPVSRWGREFMSFPISQTGDLVHITAAEDDTSVLLTRRSGASSLAVSSQLAVDVDLPAGDFVAIVSDKPLMVVQYPDVGCASVDRRPTASCSLEGAVVLPALESAPRRYLLAPTDIRQGTNVLVNMVVKSDRSGELRLNNVTLSDCDRGLLNATLYGCSGQFSLYRVSLLASSGTMEHGGEGFLLVSRTAPFIHAHQPPDIGENAADHGPGADADSGRVGASASPTPDGVLVVETTASAVISSTSLGGATRQAVIRSAASTRRQWTMTPTPTAKKPLKPPGGISSNEILKDDPRRPSPFERFPSPLEPSGVPFVVKEAGARKEINFHEAESRAAWRDDGSGTPGLDITVIAVIVSLASAVILVVVVVFGFLVAEFLCRQDRRVLPKMSLSLTRFARNRRRIGDCGPLMKDNFEMFSRDTEGEMPP